MNPASFLPSSYNPGRIAGLKQFLNTGAATPTGLAKFLNENPELAMALTDSYEGSALQNLDANDLALFQKIFGTEGSFFGNTLDLVQMQKLMMLLRAMQSTSEFNGFGGSPNSAPQPIQTPAALPQSEPLFVAPAQEAPPPAQPVAEPVAQPVAAPTVQPDTSAAGQQENWGEQPWPALENSQNVPKPDSGAAIQTATDNLEVDSAVNPMMHGPAENLIPSTPSAVIPADYDLETSVKRDFLPPGSQVLEQSDERVVITTPNPELLPKDMLMPKRPYSEPSLVLQEYKDSKNTLDAVDYAKTFLGKQSDEALKASLPNFRNAGNHDNNCADFVSSVLESTNNISIHYENVQALFENLVKKEGWSLVPLKDMKAGDAYFTIGKDESGNDSLTHVELAAGKFGEPNNLIGSNNDPVTHKQVISMQSAPTNPDAAVYILRPPDPKTEPLAKPARGVPAATTQAPVSKPQSRPAGGGGGRPASSGPKAQMV